MEQGTILVSLEVEVHNQESSHCIPVIRGKLTGQGSAKWLGRMTARIGGSGAPLFFYTQDVDKDDLHRE